ncbi:MAG: hypothetical protein J7527_02770 [Chitinophagaceae bacterium]|nr:hypothetical protein [Chitinophagaceae bacterium]
MALATRTLSTTHSFFSARHAMFFIFPWMLFSIFGGMGPPPETAALWALLANEQMVRYTFLIAGGISMGIGFHYLRIRLADTQGSKYAYLANILMKIAIPLFVLNMAYWGYFLTSIFIKYPAGNANAKPAWLIPLGEVFTIIRMTEVALFYFATAALSSALRLTGHLSKPASFLYILFSCLGALFNLLPGTLSGPLAVANYLSYIPAFTLLMPYLIAINLLYKSGNNIGQSIHDKRRQQPFSKP